MRRGKWPFSDLFSVRGWPNRAKNGVRGLIIFPLFPVIFCIFSLLCDHDLSLFYCPYLFTFLIFYYKKKHNTAHNIHNTQPHERTHTDTPATDRDLESGLCKSNARKNPPKMPEKGKVRGISGEGSFRANRSSAAKWRRTNRTI